VRVVVEPGEALEALRAALLLLRLAVSRLPYRFPHLVSHLSSFQLIDQQCKGQLDLHDYQLVKDSLCGQIYDSTPVDFTSDLGTRFVLHPSVLKRPHPPRVVSWMAKALATGLDTLFISRFEAERADYWQTLYSSVVRLHFLSHICLSSLKLSTFFF
ncbi:hypothetical protein B296_00034551, partial [Ensete ventricosum]